MPNDVKVKAQRFLKYRKSDHAEKENDMRKDLSFCLPHTARRALALALTVPMLLSACGKQATPPATQTPTTSAAPTTAVTEHVPDRNIKIGIQRHPEKMVWFETLSAFPTPENPDEPFAYDLRSKDVTTIDLQPHAELLYKADFDTKTVWPQTLPEGFDPVALQELGKNPGLGVRTLHEQGIDGRGISIGIIDQTLLVDHEEYADRLMHYEEIPESNYPAAMHGAAVASLAVGKTCGVAPAAKLYYIGSILTTESAPNEITYEFYAQSIHRLLDLNLQLPKEEQIRVISISRGFDSTDKGYLEVMAAVERAKEEGVFIADTSIAREYGFELGGLQRPPLSDPDDMKNYGIGSWQRKHAGQFAKIERIFFPMNNRTYASWLGEQDYCYSNEGGWSWVMPYVSGLYALCCQVNPDVTPDSFWKAVQETAHRTEEVISGQKLPLTIVNPPALLEAMAK